MRIHKEQCDAVEVYTDADAALVAYSSADQACRYSILRRPCNKMHVNFIFFKRKE